MKAADVCTYHLRPFARAWPKNSSSPRKPSVATDIARALGGFTRNGDYFESDDYVLSSAVGHLLEIAMPEEEEVKRGKWTFTHLPVIPPHFDLAPIEKSEDAAEDCCCASSSARTSTALINACDAGREGELIFRYIVQHAKTEEADRAAVAAVDDAGVDPRRLRATAQPTRRCCRSPTPRRAAPNPTGWSASTARAR